MDQQVDKLTQLLPHLAVSEKIEAQAQSSEENPKVQTIKSKLPTADDFTQPSFYIRDCYPKYYDIILEAFKNPNILYITLTGAPGIGKSIFYLYFFQRYRQEQPGDTIVTASFIRSSLSQCRVFSIDSINGEASPIVPGIPGALYLYDGAPDNRPPLEKMVSFTSPSFGWLQRIRKNPHRCTLYVPTWTLVELQDANELLKLRLDCDKIEERYLLFGGSARHCLERDEDLYRDAADELRQKVYGITSWDLVKACLQVNKDNDEISHRIFHHVPVDSEFFPFRPSDYTFDFSSKQVIQMVEERIIDKSEEKKAEMVQWLKGTSKSAGLLGWMFEAYAKNVLSIGGDHTAKSLSGQADLLLTLEKAGYVHANVDNYESIDGFYHDPVTKQLFLFQMTRSYNHPVKANGIVNHIKSMNLNPSVDQTKATLIFVVPKGMSDYKKQQIVVTDFSNPMSSHGSNIKGIGPVYESDLNKLGIKTVQQLADAIEQAKKMPNEMKTTQHVKVLAYQKRLNVYMDLANSEQDWAFVKDIPQFVLELVQGDYK